MRLDHVSYACGPEGLDATVERLGGELGVEIPAGGVHPRFGTTNAILPLADGIYLEVVATLPHPAADKAPFGQAVRRRSEAGGGWLGWVVAVDDLAPVEARLGRESVPGQRKRPDGHELEWRQIGVNSMIDDPQLPFFVRWSGDGADHPSAAADGSLRLVELELSGDRARLADWLGEPQADPLDGVHVAWVDGPPGLVAATIDTPRGPVRLA